MQDPMPTQRISPDAMTDPACKDGGGHDAASALAIQLVENASIDEGIARRLRQAFDGDTESCAALKLGVSNTAIRRACRSGRPSARLLRRVCLLYNVDGTWLLTGQGSPRGDASAADAMPSEHLLLEVASRLSKVITTLESARSSRVQDLHSSDSPKPAASDRHADRNWL